MQEFGDMTKMIQSIKPEQTCISSVVFSSPDGVWWVKGKHFFDTHKAYIHPVMRLLNYIGMSRPGTVYVIDTLCPTCDTILRAFPQFDKVIIRSYSDQ